MLSNVDESQKPYGEQKKPETSVYTILFHSLTVPEQVKLIYSDKKWWLPGAGEAWGALSVKGMKSILKGDKNVLYCDCGDGYMGV